MGGFSTVFTPNKFRIRRNRSRIYIIEILINGVSFHELFDDEDLSASPASFGVPLRTLINPTAGSEGRIWNNTDHLPGKGINLLGTSTDCQPYTGVRMALTGLYNVLTRSTSPPASKDYSLGKFCHTKPADWDAATGNPVRAAMIDLAKAGVTLPPLQVNRDDFSVAQIKRMCSKLASEFEGDTIDDIRPAFLSPDGARLIRRARRMGLMKML
jgi:hypothetical protein